MEISVGEKCVEIHVMLFKNWKHVFEWVYQTGPVSGMYCDKSQKCKISLNLPLGSLEVFIYGESNLKFQYSVNKS